MPIPVTLKVFRGSELVRTERFHREIIKVGRVASAHLCLDDESISRVHSAIEVLPDGSISIIDMSSAEGTFVNGEKVSRGRLRPGDEITLGCFRIVIEATRDTAGEDAHAEVEPEPAPARTRVADAPRRPELQPAAAPVEDLMGEPDLGVELRITWGDVLLHAETFVRPKEPVLVGETPRCTIRLEGLPVRELPVLRWQDGEYRFTFARWMSGVVEENGTRTSFSDVVASRMMVVDDAVQGVYSIAVPRAGAVRTEVGARFAIETRPKRPQRVKPAPLRERINFDFLNLFLVLLFLQAGFILAANNFPYDTDVVADDLLERSSRLVKFVAVPPESQPSQPGMHRREEKLTERRQPEAEHAGEEGQTGRKDALATGGRSRPRAIDPNARKDVRNVGLVGLLGRGRGLSTVFGPGGLGGDLRGAVGNIVGPLVADSNGLGGLSIRGSGTGGGDQGANIGIAPIGMKGPRDANYDLIEGKIGKKRVRVPTIDVTPDVQGSVDKELIRRVIQEHASQIRYCYEQQLAIKPTLQGRVSIRWTIQGDGSVADPKVDVSATTIEDASVHECMMSRITSWTFPKPRGGGVAFITYPWVLRSSGGQ